MVGNDRLSEKLSVIKNEVQVGRIGSDISKISYEPSISVEEKVRMLERLPNDELIARCVQALDCLPADVRAKTADHISRRILKMHDTLDKSDKRPALRLFMAEFLLPLEETVETLAEDYRDYKLSEVAAFAMSGPTMCEHFVDLGDPKMPTTEKMIWGKASGVYKTLARARNITIQETGKVSASHVVTVNRRDTTALINGARQADGTVDKEALRKTIGGFAKSADVHLNPQAKLAREALDQVMAVCPNRDKCDLVLRVLEVLQNGKAITPEAGEAIAPILGSLSAFLATDYGKRWLTDFAEEHKGGTNRVSLHKAVVEAARGLHEIGRIDGAIFAGVPNIFKDFGTLDGFTLAGECRKLSRKQIEQLIFVFRFAKHFRNGYRSLRDSLTNEINAANHAVIEAQSGGETAVNNLVAEFILPNVDFFDPMKASGQEGIMVYESWRRLVIAAQGYNFMVKRIEKQVTVES